jgi:hypothetical protein
MTSPSPSGRAFRQDLAVLSAEIAAALGIDHLRVHTAAPEKATP